MNGNDRRSWRGVGVAVTAVGTLMVFISLWFFLGANTSKCCQAHAFRLQRMTERIDRLSDRLETTAGDWNDHANHVTARLQSLAAQVQHDRLTVAERIKSVQAELAGVRAQPTRKSPCQGRGCK